MLLSVWRLVVLLVPPMPSRVKVVDCPARNFRNRGNRFFIVETKVYNIRSDRRNDARVAKVVSIAISKSMQR